MVEQNPFSGFQTDPFFDQFGGDFFSNPIDDIDNSFADFFEEEPEIPFQGALQKANLPFNQRQTFKNKRQEIFNQFQGLLRFDPTLRFTNLIDAFDFNRESFRTPPGQRVGGGTSQFRPPTTFGR